MGSQLFLIVQMLFWSKDCRYYTLILLHSQQSWTKTKQLIHGLNSPVGVPESKAPGTSLLHKLSQACVLWIFSQQCQGAEDAAPWYSENGSVFTIHSYPSPREWGLLAWDTCMSTAGDVHMSSEHLSSKFWGWNTSLSQLHRKCGFEVCFFQTFSRGGWRGKGVQKVHGNKWIPAASGRLLKDLLALKAKVLCKSFSRTRL